MKELIEKIKAKIGKLYKRFRLFCYLFAIWAITYSSVSICNFSIAFEYDDGIVYSRDAWQKAYESKGDFYYNLNSNYNYERTKIIPYLIMLIFKASGFKIDFIVDRQAINTSGIIRKWDYIVSSIYFLTDQNQKYELLESKKYLIFFSNSDEGIIQARKSNTWVIRIKRNIKSLNKLSYNPGKFNEKIIPLSEF